MSKEKLYTCRFSDSGRGFGFAVIPEEERGETEDIYISSEETMGAMTGDTVLVRRFRRGEAGYSRGNEGEIVEIVAHANTEIIGIFYADAGVPSGGTVRPDNEKIHAIVRVGDAGGARTGDKVAVHVEHFPAVRRAGDVHVLAGVVTAVFGRADTREANYAAILHRHGIRAQFPEAVLAEAAESAARAVEIGDRCDLREMPTLTIDGADAKDLDDAISLTREGDGWRLGVHIADVSHYVPAGGEVDREAYRRGTSVYFVDKVVPMLPETLSNGACSLGGGLVRYALSAFIKIDRAGNPCGYEFKKTVIRSDVRGVYDEVNDLLAHGRDSAFLQKYEAVYDMLLEMRALYTALADAAARRGQLALESAEVKFTLDPSGIPTDIYPKMRGTAEKMIEQFMLAANVAAAAFLTERGAPCLYRVHPDPMPEKLRAFGTFVHNMNLSAFRFGEGTTTKELSRILAAAEERGIAEVVSGVMLRSLSKARYSEIPSPHYGLALKRYAHFTSPIRRYPDLFVHRAITAVLTGARMPARAAETAYAASEAELRAVAAERQIEDLYMAQYASFRVGEEYGAVISSVCSFGVFARTDKYFEGLIPLSELFSPGVHADFDESSLTLRGRCGKERRTYRLGDRLTVTVARADVTAGQIDLALAGDSTVPTARPTREMRMPRERREKARSKSLGGKPSGKKSRSQRRKGNKRGRR